MTDLDPRVPELWADFERRLHALESTQQLSTSTVGETDEDATPVDEIVADAAISYDAVVDLQDDVAAANDGVSSLGDVISASMSEVDARLELADVNLDTAREDIAASQQQIEETFGQTVEGLSDDVDTAIRAAGSATTEAQAASDAARDAAGLAASKGETITQLSPPTGSRASAANLWIDLTPDANSNPKNTPNRYVSYSSLSDPTGVTQIATKGNVGTERVVDGMTLTGLPVGVQLAVNVGLYASMDLSGYPKRAIARLRDGGLTGPVLASYTFTDKGDSVAGDAERWDYGAYLTPSSSTLVVTIQSDNENAPDVYASRRLVAGSVAKWIPVTDQKAIDAAAIAATASAAAQAAKTVADQANTAAGVAKQSAADANTAALQAAGIANAKGKVIPQASKPTGSNAAAGNLWIRTTDNTPWIYDTSIPDWVQVTDQTAKDAASAAVKAQQDATAAANAAKAAQATADGRPQILFSSTAGPSGTAPTGTIWFLWDSVKNVAGQWLQSGTLAAPVWTPQQIRSEVIANLDVAKLTAGSAAIADLVAQKIAASTANFQTANVSNLFVTSGATMSQAVIDFLFVNVVQAKKITAGMIDVDSLNGVTITGAIFQTAATGKRAVLGGNLIRFYDANNLQAGQIEGISNGAAGGVLRISPDGSDTVAIFIGAWSLAFGGTAAMRAPSLYVSTHYVDTTLSAATGKVIGGDTDWRAVPNGGSGYTGDGAGGYRVKNGDIRLRGQFNRPSGSVTAGDLIGLLPAGARPPYRSWFLASTGTGGIARCYLDTNGQIYVSSIIGTAASYLIFEQKAVATVD